jgi:hypothetical protein
VILSKENRIQELASEISDLKNKQNSLIDTYVQTEDSFIGNEGGDHIAQLEEENIVLKQNNDDLKDEIVEKRREVAVFEEQLGQIEKLKDSASSLSDELGEVNAFACELCSDKFVSSHDLKEHRRTFHEERLRVKHELLMKLDRIQKRISQQGMELTSAIFALQKKERIERKMCRCRRHCRISHEKHNFVKFQSEKFSQRLKDILTN